MSFPLRPVLRMGSIGVLLLGLAACPAAETAWQAIAVRTAAGTVLSPDRTVVRDTGATIRWPAVSEDRLHITPPARPGAKGLDLTLGYGEQAPAVVRLVVRGPAEETLATFTLHPQGLGWRRLVVDLRVDAESFTGGGAPRDLVLTTPGWSGDLWLGSVAWLDQVPFRRTPDPYCPTIYRAGESAGADEAPGVYAAGVREWLVAYRNPVPVAPPTSLETGPVLRRYRDLILGAEGAAGPCASALGQARRTWQAEALSQLTRLGLHRQGPWVVDAAGVQPAVGKLRDLLTPAALAYHQQPDPVVLDRIFLAFDAVHQGGFGACNPGFGDDSSIQFGRLNLAGYAHAVGLLRDELAAHGRLAQVHDILRWQSRAGEMDGPRRFEVQADSLRGEAFPRLICALAAPDEASRVRELAGVRAWLTAGLAVRANLDGFIKPDLSVSHHHNPYLVEYGPHGLQAAAMMARVLADTPWALDRATLDRLEGCGDTLVALSRGFTLPMGARGRFPDGVRVMANQVPTFLALADPTVFSGRHGETARRLIQALGVPAVAEDLAGLAVRQHLGWRGLGRIAGTADDLVGVSAPVTALAPALTVANWAGIANCRRDGWSAAVQGCSRWHYDFESGNFPGVENDWGRFIRYGTIELWSGTDPFDEGSSGLTLRHGWDWSRMPGATTLALAATELRLPAPPKPRRMRNFSDQGTCAGVAGPDGLGLFALDLQDAAYPGRLAARKSVFFAGDRILCLGSGIRSTLAGTPVITTLFQFGKPSTGGAAPPAVPTTSQVDAGTRLTDPAGNAFTLLAAATVGHRQGRQTGPTSNGRTTTGDYDTAWIEHGASPTGASYAYLIEPQVRGRAAELPDYRIVQADGNAQVVAFPERHATAHALFAPVTSPVGGILACDRPCLVWMTEPAPGQVELRVVDPDLGCLDGHHRGEASESVPTTVRLKIPGRATVMAGPATGEFAPESTTCTVTCRAGLPAIVALRREP